MSLSRRLIWSGLVALTCTGLLGGAALLGMWSMSSHFDSAAQQYDQLRSVYEIGHRAALVRQMLSTSPPNGAAIERHVAAAVLELERIQAIPPATPAHDDASRVATAGIEEHLRQAADHLHDAPDHRAASAQINATLGHVATLAGVVESGIITTRKQAAAQLRTTMRRMAALFGIAILVGIIAGLVQYYGVMRPVRSLRRAVAQLTQADFTHRIAQTGTPEFRTLIACFNRMSDEIAQLHASMHDQVQSKSRQLIRSEQLAGVGYLATGVAHEINNPLAIIAGYAESTLKHLQRSDNALATDELSARTQRTLSMICEEAFRCRDITSELLELARPRGEHYEPVAIAAVVRRSANLVRGLPVARDRNLVLRIDDSAGRLLVRGDEAQLVQILINVIANALEACRPESGRVVIEVQRHADDVLITVTDNGCGMDEETLRHAFDPFFTDKPRRGLSGSGLGLAVSHAIAERHGGRLYAHSDGPECGSTMTVELPLLARANGVLHACA